MGPCRNPHDIGMQIATVGRLHHVSGDGGVDGDFQAPPLERFSTLAVFDAITPPLQICSGAIFEEVSRACVVNTMRLKNEHEVRE